MKTQYLTSSKEDLLKAAEIIKSGGLVAFPTETVYGLGGNALNPWAAKAIYYAKGRPSDNPLIVHIAKASEAFDIAMDFPKTAQVLAKKFWPGPMTMVLPKFEIVPMETTGGLDTVAVRCPSNKTARKLIELAGVPIAAPSANTSGRPSPTKWEHVRDDLDGKIDAIIMGEDCSGGIESTVVDMTGKTPLILRPGLITPEMISKVCKLPCDYDPAIKLSNLAEGSSLVPKAPGMKYKHYAPKAQMTLYSGEYDAMVQRIELDKNALEEDGKKVVCIFYKDAEIAAKNLFADLRQADADGADIILATALPETESLNYSVMNRMLKSAAYNIIEV